MTVTATAKRRRKQARNGYRHLPPRLRPRFAERAKDRAARDAAERRVKYNR